MKLKELAKKYINCGDLESTHDFAHACLRFFDPTIIKADALTQRGFIKDEIGWMLPGLFGVLDYETDFLSWYYYTNGLHLPVIENDIKTLGQLDALLFSLDLL